MCSIAVFPNLAPKNFSWWSLGQENYCMISLSVKTHIVPQPMGYTQGKDKVYTNKSWEITKLEHSAFKPTKAGNKFKSHTEHIPPHTPRFENAMGPKDP